MVLLGGLLFFLGRWTAPTPPESVKTVTLTDTVIRRDTIIRVQPVAKTQVVRDSIYVAVRDTVTVRDTCYMALPRETKTYQDDRYYAEVSGYLPSLDRIDIYEQTKIIKNDNTKTVTHLTRWGLGHTQPAARVASIYRHRHQLQHTPLVVWRHIFSIYDQGLPS